ncbi:MAG TPA: NrfD/PsrC family molybdoenzyme membrane anchor subunit [Terracidiphilus sp.]
MDSPREANLLRVLTTTSWRFYATACFLGLVVLWGVFGYITQLRHGLIVTGMRDQISWGLYIANFVFFTGISYGGTLISAILRVTDSGWRHPITRLSEAITVFALCVGGPMVIIDLGRPERMFNLFVHGRIQSAILWDVIAVSSYLAGCALYLYLPLIPDLALLAERQELAPWRRKLYRTFAFGWSDTPAERHLLEKCISRMAVLMIMLAVSVHTVVSWIFAMTLRPGWNSSIFGPYFVMGAIYSGTAAVILSMYILLRVLHLNDYLKPVHFRNLALLLVTFALLYLYFTINEYLTSAYKVEGPERLLLRQLFFGDYAVLMWLTQTLVLLVPLIMLAAVLLFKPLRRFTPPVVAAASVLVIVGAWMKRYLIVVPTLTDPFLQNKNLPYTWLHYRPTWVEWSITFGGVAVFLLMYMAFTKLFPMVSMWETRQDEAPSGEQVPEMAAASVSRRLGSLPTAGVILLAIFCAAGYARAGEKPPAKPPEPTSLSIQWHQAATPTTQTAPSQSASTPVGGSGLTRSFGRLLGWVAGTADEDQNTPPMIVTATLLGAKNQPIPYQVVALSLKTSFGKLDYGVRPTNAEGKAQFSLDDRRFGQYPVEVSYAGGDQFAAARAAASVDFGARPAPSLPSHGILITPYATAAIGVPFLVFFGATWVAFIYIGIYLLWIRLPRLRREQAAHRPA